jgi:hypothetical protein
VDVGRDLRVLAVVLAHELQHAFDAKRIDLGLLDINCVAMAVRGFAAQAAVTRLFWPDERLTETQIEHSLAAAIGYVEQDWGHDGHTYFVALDGYLYGRTDNPDLLYSSHLSDGSALAGPTTQQTSWCRSNRRLSEL